MADLSSPRIDELGAKRAVARSEPRAKRGGVRRSIARLWAILRGSEHSRARTACTVALGLFIGCLPLYGLHFPICLVLCLALRLDFVLAYLAANISIPPVAPFLLTAEVEIGSLLLTGEHAAFSLERAKSVGVSGFLLQAALGSLVVGGGLALLGAAITYAVARSGAQQRRDETADPLESAILRTVARYQHAPFADRVYVASKLRHDPVLECIFDAELQLGRVIDAGAGRGQLALALLELGRTTSVCGFDFDARKVNVARRAARSEARFEFGDLTCMSFANADTILLIDVLHYLPRAEQDRVIRGAVSGVESGGYVLVRELDAASGLRSKMTRLFERIATSIGYNRARAGLTYRSGAELVALFESLGCTCRVLSASRGTPFANVLIFAQKA